MNDGSQRPPYGQPPNAYPGAPPGYGPPANAAWGGGPAYRGAVSSGALEAAYGSAVQPSLVATTHRSQYGDAAGEYAYMARGRFNAWVYVVFAFIGQAGFLGAIPGLITGYVAAVAGASASTAGTLSLVVGAAVGFTGAYFTYRDRWKCIEAFSSRFCAGLMNISLLYVPAIAFVYANVRGVQKLFGK